jgi:hypothetical protein
MNAVARTRNQPADETAVMTRSVLELREAVLRMCVSLAAQAGEHHFVIDSCLRVVPAWPADALTV